MNRKKVIDLPVLLVFLMLLSLCFISSCNKGSGTGYISGESPAGAGVNSPAVRKVSGKVDFLNPMDGAVKSKNGNDDAPVLLRNRADAEIYCRWAGGQLPDEAGLEMLEKMVNEPDGSSTDKVKNKHSSERPEEWTVTREKVPVKLINRERVSGSFSRRVKFISIFNQKSFPKSWFTFMR